MRFLKGFVLLTIIICSGCESSSYWYSENKTYQRASSDCWDCLYQAQRKITNAPEQPIQEDNTALIDNESYRQILFENCMIDKGYQKTEDYKLEYTIRKGFVEYKGKYYYIAGK